MNNTYKTPCKKKSRSVRSDDFGTIQQNISNPVLEKNVALNLLDLQIDKKNTQAFI